MDVCTIFDFNCLFQAGNQSPKLLLHIIFGDRPVTIVNRVDRHLVFKVALLEIGGLLLKLLQRIQASFLKAELTVADKTSRAVPLRLGLNRGGGIKACAMVGVVARLANEKEADLPAFPTLLTFLFGH